MASLHLAQSLVEYPRPRGRGAGATGAAGAAAPPALVARGQRGGREMPCPCLCPCLPLPLPIIIMPSARPDQPLEVEAHSHTLPQPLTASDISVTSQSHPPSLTEGPSPNAMPPFPMHCNLHAAGSACSMCYCAYLLMWNVE